MYKVNLYLETSIRGLQKTIGWYGYVLEYMDRKGSRHIREAYKYEVGVTPNMIVLMALDAALGRLNRESEVTVFSDNVYLREGCMRRLKLWQENGWKTAHGEPVKNKVLWQQVAEKMSRHRVTFSSEYHHEYKNRMSAELTNRRMGYV